MTRLAAVRRARGFSQRALADASGVHVQTIRHFEQGRTSALRGDTLEALARALDCSLDELVGRVEAAA